MCIVFRSVQLENNVACMRACVIECGLDLHRKHTLRAATAAAASPKFIRRSFHFHFLSIKIITAMIVIIIEHQLSEFCLRNSHFHSI